MLSPQGTDENRTIETAKRIKRPERMNASNHTPVVLREPAQARPTLERLSGRGQDRVLRLARTIADLAASDAVTVEHLDEAAGYRLSDPVGAAA